MPQPPALSPQACSLARLAARVFMAWGGLVMLKGLWDCFWGQPEANYFSPRPWEFVTHAQWARYAGFELAYGAACAALGWSLVQWVRAKRTAAC